MSTQAVEYCRICGNSTAEVGKLSARGKCNDCGKRIVEDNITGILNRSGGAYERWRTGMVECGRRLDRQT